MEKKIILADTSIFIEFFRKNDKDKTALIQLVRNGYVYVISAITAYEIYAGARQGQIEYWQIFLKKTTIISFDEKIAQVAVDINNQLKRSRNQIDIPDLFIAATAKANNLPLATLNTKHFNRINNLILI
jgi:predicted nucleic acid-binding protein